VVSRRVSVGDLPDTPSGTRAELAAIVRMVLGPSRREEDDARAEAERKVEDHVVHLASDVLAALKSGASSPKLRDELDRLAGIARLARELDRKLASLDPITRDLMADDLAWQQRPQKLDKGPAPAPAPSARTAADVLRWSPDLGIPMLEALARAAEATRKFFAGRAASSSGKGMKRGSENLRGHLIGDVRLYLAFECAKMLGRCQGAQVVTGTEDGPLYKLTAAVWRYAIGQASEEPWDALAHVVKRVAPAARPVAEALDAFGSASVPGVAGRRLIDAERKAEQRLYRRPRRP
jgi:hypothetical protein